MAVFTGTLLALLLAAAYGVALLATRGARVSDVVPFGPFLLAAALAVGAS